MIWRFDTIAWLDYTAPPPRCWLFDPEGPGFAGWWGGDPSYCGCRRSLTAGDHVSRDRCGEAADGEVDTCGAPCPESARLKSDDPAGVLERLPVLLEDPGGVLTRRQNSYTPRGEALQPPSGSPGHGRPGRSSRS